MTTVASRPALTPAAPSDPSRDRAIDVARAVCLVLVVGLHAIMVGVSVQDGVPVLENAMQRWDGFAAATWIVQMMPLFFVLGGFSSYTQWTRMQARGQSAGSYLAGRVRRLVPPSAAAAAAIAVVLAVLSLAGVPEAVVAEAGFRISQPLWFLGVYLLCTVCVPALVALHRRQPLVTFTLLALAAITVDMVRGATGIEGLGYVNLICVWLATQQLGFFLADGSLHRLPRAAWTALAVGGASVLATLCLLGVYGWNLFDALNPPTFALVLLGASQLGVLLLTSARLRAWYGLPVVRRAVDGLGRDAMTVYAWHMGVLVLAGGALVLVPNAAPVPLTAAWWQTRPLWFVAVGVLVWLAVRAASRFDRCDGRAVTNSGARAFAAAAVAAAGVVLILATGGAPSAWVVGTVLQLAGARLALAAAVRVPGHV